MVLDDGGTQLPSDVITEVRLWIIIGIYNDCGCMMTEVHYDYRERTQNKQH